MEWFGLTTWPSAPEDSLTFLRVQIDLKIAAGNSDKNETLNDLQEGVMG